MFESVHFFLQLSLNMLSHTGGDYKPTEPAHVAAAGGFSPSRFGKSGLAAFILLSVSQLQALRWARWVTKIAFCPKLG
jgi:hypothetical protein